VGLQSTSTTRPVYETIGLALRKEAPDLPVGPVVWERRPALDVVSTSQTQEGDAQARIFDVCRLLVATAGLTVYLSIPVSLIFLAVKLAV
jgi:hypothetical protein